ncbi:MAG: Serine/threonine-protein kinase PknB [Planctomycetota bacterium]
MSELTVVRGPGRGASVALDAERGARIGTSTDADLRVGGDGIADTHVVVKALRGGGFGVKALAGPIELNGNPTEAARLQDGDVLTIGDSQIRYAETATAAVTADELPGFRLLGVLGRGGWGTVYRAEQVSLGREVALKVLSEERLGDPMFVGRFQAEARAAARLHHPNVVQVFDVDHAEGRWFYSMELMHGGSLEQRLKREGRLPTEAAIEAIRDAARGLAFAEEMRIVHRDIKPDNLMVDRHGHVKIADLGLAQTDDDSGGSRAGTPHFMSPEQVPRQSLDHRSDLYSLGCTFYRLTTGKTPFQGDSVKQILRAQLEDEAEPAHARNPELPSAVGEVIEKLMAKAPEERYQSAAELIADLDALLAPPARRGVLLPVIAGVAVLAAGAAIYVAMNREEPGETQTITQTEYVVDPEAQAALEENRRIKAQNALLSVQARGLAGAELAAALEGVAQEHEGTPAADQAATQASAIRSEIQAREAAAMKRRAAIESAVAALRSAVEQALASDDLPAAAAALAGAPTDANVADATELAAARAELDTTLKARALAVLESRKSTLESALQTRDPAAAEAAAEALARLVGPEGWPDALLPDRAAWTAQAAAGQQRVAELVTDIAESAQVEAWTALREAFLRAEGVATALAAMRFEDAAQQLESIAAAQTDFLAGQRAAALAPAVRAATGYWSALQADLDANPRSFIDPRSGEEVTLAGASADGFRLKSGPRIRPREETVPLAIALQRPEVWFVATDAAPAGSRAAFLGGLALAHHVPAAAAYLRTIDPANDASGTGDAAFDNRPGAFAPALADLEGVDAPWAATWREELEAGALLARSLTALSTRRNLAAATLAEQLRAERAGTLVVRCVR